MPKDGLEPICPKSCRSSIHGPSSPDGQPCKLSYHATPTQFFFQNSWLCIIHKYSSTVCKQINIFCTSQLTSLSKNDKPSPPPPSCLPSSVILDRAFELRCAARHSGDRLGYRSEQSTFCASWLGPRFRWGAVGWDEMGSGGMRGPMPICNRLEFPFPFSFFRPRLRCLMFNLMFDVRWRDGLWDVVSYCTCRISDKIEPLNSAEEKGPDLAYVAIGARRGGGYGISYYPLSETPILLVLDINWHFQISTFHYRGGF
ncbi:hypothetical protein HOY82DRAFT_11349 [Tuber indicum]|nr:hypothetical protein HOY82DRAFT_11349 [Tuber indicum]